jgi:hypothetical protein
MRTLITSLATAMLLVTGSSAWKAEATVAGVGILPSPTGADLSVERVDCFLGPCVRPPGDYNLGPNRAEIYNYYRRGGNWYAPPPSPYGHPYATYGYGRPYAHEFNRR